jgi:DNA-binding response OmpR family regulator
MSTGATGVGAGNGSTLYVGQAFTSAQLAAVGMSKANDLRDAIESAPAGTDLVLLDLREGKSALAQLPRLRTRLPRCRVVVLVDAKMPIQTRLDAMAAGCDAVLVIAPNEAADSLRRQIDRLSPSLQRRTVLVVDDEENNRELLRQELTDANLDVILANDGHTALSLVGRADLMLLDIMMPGMDGREVCRRVRAHEATHKLPIIVVSAMGEIKDKLTALELGANDYVTKPFDADQLIQKVRRLLRQSAARGKH